MRMQYRNARNAEAVARIWGKPLDRPDWYRIEAKSDEETEILIYDVIGWPYIDAEQFVHELAQIETKRILVRINSPGGDVFDSAAIYNSLKNHSARVTSRIEGLAASGASVIALAGDEVQAHANAMLMIHDPWVITLGNQYDLRAVADVLEKIGITLMAVYEAKSNIKRAELKKMMREETWFTAEEADGYDLVDTVIEIDAEAQARFDLSIFDNAPEGISVRAPGGELTKRAIEKALRDAGASKTFALKIAAGCSDSNGESLRDADEKEVQDALKNLLAKMGG